MNNVNIVQKIANMNINKAFSKSPTEASDIFTQKEEAIQNDDQNQKCFYLL